MKKISLSPIITIECELKSGSYFTCSPKNPLFVFLYTFNHRGLNRDPGCAIGATWGAVYPSFFKFSRAAPGKTPPGEIVISKYDAIFNQQGILQNNIRIVSFFLCLVCSTYLSIIITRKFYSPFLFLNRYNEHIAEIEFNYQIFFFSKLKISFIENQLFE